MKEQYNTPEMNVTFLDARDVIATSTESVVIDPNDLWFNGGSSAQ